jgi:hypothetical protein
VSAVCSVCGNIISVYFITGVTVLRSRAMFDVWHDIPAMCRHRKMCHKVNWTIVHQGRFHLPVIMNALIFDFVKSREFLGSLSVCLSVYRISRETKHHVVSYFSSQLIGYLV